MRGPKEDLKLIVLQSCLVVTVLGYLPFSEETSGVVTVIGVEGVRRRIRRDSSRHGDRRLADLGRKWPKDVI